MIGPFRWWAGRTEAVRNPQLAGVFLAAALLFACGNDSVSDEPGSDLRDIDRIEDLKAIFNRDAGVPRLILLLSPT